MTGGGEDPASQALQGRGAVPIRLWLDETWLGMGQVEIEKPSGVAHNPIGASGMIRFGEAAMQVRGQASDHQGDGVRRALGYAYGGATQFFAI